MTGKPELSAIHCQFLADHPLVGVQGTGLDEFDSNTVRIWSVNGFLICMLIYRSAVEIHEHDQIFLDPAEDSIARDQRAIFARVEKLTRLITALWLLSGTLFVAIAALWMWQVLKTF